MSELIKLTMNEKISLSVLIETRIEKVEGYLTNPDFNELTDSYQREIAELTAINAKLGW